MQSANLSNRSISQLSGQVFQTSQRGSPKIEPHGLNSEYLQMID